MTDIALTWDAAHGGAEMTLAAADLATGDELASAVLLSLFCWRRAAADDRLPWPEHPRLGWWGDSFATQEGDRFGSRLWLLQRETITAETLSRARIYAKEALAWLVEDKVAERVEVEVERQGLDRVALRVTIIRGPARAIDMRFDDLWRQIRG